jgi:hypothetical protein
MAKTLEPCVGVGHVEADLEENTPQPPTWCNIPRFYQFLGEFFFVFVFLEMFGNSQRFKTF